MKKIFRSFISGIYHFVGFIIGETMAKRIKFLIQRFLKSFKPVNTNRDDVLRLSEITKSGKPFKLHFGADIRVLKGWINLDIAPYHKSEDYPFPDSPELRGGREDYFQIDFREGPLPLLDNSVDVIFHEDFIEHLTQKETVLFLAETYRILKPGGIHRINTPELISSLKKHCDFNKGFSGIKTEEWDRYVHHQVLTRNFLKELVTTIGYKEIIFNSRNMSLSKALPKEYRPGDDRKDDEQIFCDLIK